MPKISNQHGFIQKVQGSDDIKKEGLKVKHKKEKIMW